MADPAEEDIRAFLLPLMIPKGKTEPELAVPGILKEPYDAMQRLLSNPYQPGAGEENNQAIMDALTVGGSAGLGSIAAPRPANSLGVFGGPRMTANLNKHGIDPFNDPRFASKYGENRELYRDHTGLPKFEIDFSQTKVNPRYEEKLGVYDFGDPSNLSFAGKLPDLIDNEMLFKAMPEAKDAVVTVVKPMTEGRIGGKISGTKDRITAEAGNKDDLMNVLSHEIQHMLQRYEGQEFGASPKHIRPEFILQIMKEHARGEPFSVGKRPYPPEMQAYLRNSAEVEARNAAHRRNLSVPVRELSPPVDTEDIPRDRQFNMRLLELLRNGVN